MYRDKLAQCSELDIDFTKYDIIEKDKLDNDCKDFQIFAKYLNNLRTF